MPHMVLCGLRSMRLSRTFLATTKPGLLNGPRAQVSKNSATVWSNDQMTSGLHIATKAPGRFLASRQIGSARESKGFLRKKIQHSNYCRTQQLRFLSTQPNEEEKPQPPSRILPKALNPLHENIYTLPNALTVTRLLCAPAIGHLLLHNHYTWALGFFVYAGVTDLVDGWIARKWDMQTVVGTVLDPMADKALMTIAVGVLGWEGWMPVPLAVLILGRDVLLSLTAFYYRYISLPPPKTFARYWDFSLPSAEVRPTTISKINTFLQLGLIGATMTGLAFPDLMGETTQSLFEVSWWIVGGTTIWSGASYIGRGGVRILSKKG